MHPTDLIRIILEREGFTVNSAVEEKISDLLAFADEETANEHAKDSENEMDE